MPQTETKASLALLDATGLKALLDSISPYMARRYRTTFTTTVQASDIINFYRDSIPDIIVLFFETLPSNNNRLQEFDLIELTLTSSDNVLFPILILKTTNDDCVFVKLQIGDSYVSGICDFTTSMKFICNDNNFMPEEDILYMLDHAPLIN